MKREMTASVSGRFTGRMMPETWSGWLSRFIPKSSGKQDIYKPSPRETAGAAVIGAGIGAAIAFLFYNSAAAWILGKVDLENDWPAIFYYYGYVGFAAYCGFILFFLVRILRRLRRDFRSAVTADNFILLVTFVLLIGIAQFSGAVLRRPNVSFYLSLILGLIYFQTDPDPAKQIGSWRGEWI